MIVGVLHFTIYLHGNTSLKGKRQVANSLKQKLRNKFNVAVSEIQDQNVPDKLVLAVVTLANETKRVESHLHKALAMVEAISPDEVADVEMEVFGA